MSTVLVSLTDATVHLKLNRPERLNAVNEALYGRLLSELAAADRDPATRSVVLSGVGRAFCVGADLQAHSEGTRTRQDQAHYLDLAQQVCRQIQTMSTPVVAAVHGYALGAGAEMAVSADFLVMADDALMGFPEVGLGTFVGGGVTHRLPRLVGLRRATDLLMLGERFTGTQAYDWGLTFATVPADDVAAAADRLAATLATKAPLSIGRMKSMLRLDPTLDVALSSEPTHLLDLMQTRDWAEGVAAFAERRTPVFQGE